LIEPICQASLQAYHHQSTNALLFSNPASTSKRVNMTVRVSFDNGQSWPDSVLLHPAPSAYSDLVVLNNGTIGCLFESGQENPYETIVYTQLELKPVE
jgi:sialidase-1